MHKMYGGLTSATSANTYPFQSSNLKIRIGVDLGVLPAHFTDTNNFSKLRVLSETNSLEVTFKEPD